VNKYSSLLACGQDVPPSSEDSIESQTSEARSRGDGQGQIEKGLGHLQPLFALRPPERRLVQIGGLRPVELAPDPVIRVQHIMHDVVWILEGGQDPVTGPRRIHHLVASVPALLLLASLFGRQAQLLGLDVA
jgi:hypothetical protein